MSSLKENLGETDFPPETCNDEKNDKPMDGSPIKGEAEVSLYESTTPRKARTCTTDRLLHKCQDVEDGNSRDSGCGGSSSWNTFSSRESIDLMDDEFMALDDFFVTEKAELVGNIETLVNDSPTYKLPFRATLNRSKSVCDDKIASTSACTSLFKSPLKRQEAPIQEESPCYKRFKSLHVSAKTKPVFCRSTSATEESIMQALQKSESQPDLIGDFSTTFCLPTTFGRHQDLKSISSSTLVTLIRGELKDTVASFKIIDCRYPYEYKGGHINGALNIFTKKQLVNELLNTTSVNTDPNGQERNILIFHCEFSSERGPNLCRFLRNQDRIRNKSVYPVLNYPELYVLEGGYKNFYLQYSDLCTPVAYKPMLDPEHKNDLIHYRANSRTDDRAYQKK